MPKGSEGLEQLLIQELQDLFDAEKQLVRALPKMARSANDEELENAFREHLEVTKGQVQRLEQVFESMDMRARSRPCKGMRGIVEEGQEIMGEDRGQAILDSALAGAGRKVEHYEMAGYESVRALAQKLGMKEAAGLLQETLREEMETDRLLAQISKRLLKESSSRGTMSEEEGQSGRRTRGTSSGRRQASGRQSSSRQSSSRRTSAARGGSQSARGSRGGQGHAAHPLIDHDEIRQWAEQREGQPSCVRGTGGRGDVGMIRLDFPGYSGEKSLEPISWDEWFEEFDKRNLALIVQETTSGGEQSNFNKLVKRESVEQRQRPKARAAR
jgi:ferritin-like metal-binding protein YciE